MLSMLGDVLAIDELIKLRQADGLEVTPEDLHEFTSYQEWIGERRGPVKFCQNCSYILPEVKSIPGKRIKPEDKW
jgi:hypothetical protein